MRSSLNTPYVGETKFEEWRRYPIEYPNRKQRRKYLSRRKDENFIYVDSYVSRKNCAPKDAIAIFHFTKGFRLVPAYDKKHG